jgi:hypothetical protein
MDISSMSGVLSVGPIHSHSESANRNRDPPFRTPHIKEHLTTYALLSCIIRH